MSTPRRKFETVMCPLAGCTGHDFPVREGAMSKPATAQHTPCGCRIVRVWGESGHRGDTWQAIEYCPTHRAAPRMLEALADIGERLHALANGGGATSTGQTMGQIKSAIRLLRDEARAILRDVEG